LDDRDRKQALNFKRLPTDAAERVDLDVKARRLT
jgi:hypothetical protein